MVDNNVYQNIPDATEAIQSSVLAQRGCNIRVVIADTSAGGQASHGSCRSSHTRMILGPFWGMHLDQGLDSLSNKPRGQDSRVPYSPRQRNSPVSLFAWPTPQGAGRQQLPAGLAATARDVYVRCVLPYVRHHLADAATPAR